jgi:hypothetical protein
MSLEMSWYGQPERLSGVSLANFAMSPDYRRSDTSHREGGMKDKTYWGAQAIVQVTVCILKVTYN